MAYSDSIPAVSNQISSDISSMQANFVHLKDAFENFVGAWSDSDPTGIYPAKFKYRNVTSSATMSAGDTFVRIAPSGAGVTYTLLSAATLGNGYPITVRCTDAVSYTSKISAASGEFIEGYSDYVFFSDNHTVTLVTYNGAWIVVNEDIPPYSVVNVSTTNPPSETILVQRPISMGMIRVPRRIEVGFRATVTSTLGINIKLGNGTSGQSLSGGALKPDSGSDPIHGFLACYIHSTSAQYSITNYTRENASSPRPDRYAATTVDLTASNNVICVTCEAGTYTPTLAFVSIKIK